MPEQELPHLIGSKPTGSRKSSQNDSHPRPGLYRKDFGSHLGSLYHWDG
jgi:hypothetical protein